MSHILDAQVDSSVLFCIMYYTYILTNHTRNVFYTGMTNDLRRRVREHQANKGIAKTFCGRYYCNKLVYYEEFERPMQAINREKEIKKMSRQSRINLIKTKNPKLEFWVP